MRWLAFFLWASAASAQQLITPPIIFEPNQGQAAPEALFLGRSGQNLFFFTERAVVFALPVGETEEELVVMRFGERTAAGGSKPLVAEHPTGGVSHYFRGNDPRKWRRHIPHYKSVRYPEIYEGIDLVFHADGGHLEYDFEVEPGADLSQIQIEFWGGETRKEPRTGDLLIETAHNWMRHRQPRAVQPGSDDPSPIDGEFRLTDGRVGFVFRGYEQELDLLVDPIIEFSTTLGTQSFLSYRDRNLAVDSHGSPIVASATTSHQFPIKSALQERRDDFTFSRFGRGEGYIMKLTPDGGDLVFSTYFGGNGDDRILAVAVTGQDEVLIGGRT